MTLRIETALVNSTSERTVRVRSANLGVSRGKLLHRRQITRTIARTIKPPRILSSGEASRRKEVSAKRIASETATTRMMAQSIAMAMNRTTSATEMRFEIVRVKRSEMAAKTIR